MEVLTQQGWNLSETGYNLISSNGKVSDVRQLAKIALDHDLKEIGTPNLASKLNNNVLDKVVLQIHKVRNISAPKANEYSQAAPRMLKFILTDGFSHCQAIEMGHLNVNIDKAAPGTKLLLNNAKIINGFVLLDPQACSLLGGKVAALYEKWELAKTVSSSSQKRQVSCGTEGPPPWVPFGNKIPTINGDGAKMTKSLPSTSDSNNKASSEFEEQRKGAIAEAGSGLRKTFGGGTKQAMKLQTQNQQSQQQNSYKKPERHEKQNEERVGGGAGEFRKGRGGKGRNREAKEPEEKLQKPSENISLFDFLADKIPAELNQTTTKPEKEFINKPNNNYNNSYNKERGSGGGHRGGRNQGGYQRTERESNRFTTNNYANKNAANNFNQTNSNPTNFDYDSFPSFQNNNSKGNERPYHQKDQRNQEHNYNAGQRNAYSNREKKDYHQNKDKKDDYQKRDDKTSFNRFNNKAEGGNRNSFYGQNPQQQQQQQNYGNYGGYFQGTNSNQNPGNYHHQYGAANLNTGNRTYNNQYTHNQGYQGAASSYQGVNNKINNKEAEVMSNLSEQFSTSVNLNSTPENYANTNADFATRSFKRHLGLMTGNPKPQTPNPNPHPHSVGPNLDETLFKTFQFKKGDHTLAKYWEDGKYYRATVIDVTTRTCVVQFNDYGNIEEVLTSDCIPVTTEDQEAQFLNSTASNNSGREFRRSKKKF